MFVQTNIKHLLLKKICQFTFMFELIHGPLDTNSNYQNESYRCSVLVNSCKICF